MSQGATVPLRQGGCIGPAQPNHSSKARILVLYMNVVGRPPLWQREAEFSWVARLFSF